MPYTHFRFMAYEVPTVTYITGVKKDGRSGWDAGADTPAVPRIPLPAEVTNADVRSRLRRFASVVNYADLWLTLTGEDNHATLKVFILPEFYFRPPAIDASYYSNTYPNSVKNQILVALNEMFAHADFQHWVFVCGTILWNSREDVRRQALYFNTAVTVQGGPRPDAYGRQDAILSVIEKNLPSGIDGILGPAPGNDTHLSQHLLHWSSRRRRVFNVGPHTLGLEVCLDHLDSANCRVLKRALGDWQANAGAAPPDVQLHLLPAGGMPIKPGSVAAQVGGYILRNDGITNPGARSQLQRVDNYNRDTGYTVVFSDEFDPDPDSYATLTDIATESAANLPTALLQPMPGSNYQTFKQRVAVYPRQAMPA